MKMIDVPVSRHYEVVIGRGVRQRLPELIRGKTVCIVSDTNVWPLHGETVRKLLEESGYSVFSYVFPAGEASKNGQTYLSLLNVLAEKRLTRADTLVALGGGVVGDLTGFAAATYLRGVAYVQMPTTVLAAVDSSVGGKTAIDLPSGKNLAGAFYQPWGVLCDLDFLDTLPPSIVAEGCAELIKTAVLFDPDLFGQLEKSGPDFDRETAIAAAVRHKRNVVVEDERDTGARQLLNLGHTFGHGIEHCSHFAISHGQAVAIGTCMAARASCPGETARRIETLFRSFGLPTKTNFSAKELAQAALSDKKRQGGTISLILPRAIGQCAIVPTPVEELETFMRRGL